MADPLTNPAKLSNCSYTFATGKRPGKYGDIWTWHESSDDYKDVRPDFNSECLPESIFDCAGDLPGAVWGEDGWLEYPTYFDAIAAANDAARRAIADGAWKPEAA